MNQYKTNTINLKSYNFGEADKIAVMYSKEHGLLKAVVKGARRIKNKFSGRTEALTATNMVISKRKNLDVLYQADIANNFKLIRKDIDKITYAMYCCELVSAFGLENDLNCEEIYNLLYSTLENINNSTGTSETITYVINFQIKYLQMLGYGLELDSCIQCGNNNETQLSSICINAGGVLCLNCAPYNLKDKALNENSIKLLKDLMLNMDSKFKPDEFSLKYCFNILKNSFSSHSDKKIKSSELIECLC